MRLRNKHIETEKEYNEQLKTSRPSPLPDTKSTQDSGINYYRFNISWTENTGVSEDTIRSMCKFFTDLGLKKVDEYEVDNNWRVERTIEYEFVGSKDSFEMLQKTSITILNILVEDRRGFNVMVYGKKLK